MKILILAGFDRSLVNFRGPLIRDLVAAGYEVVTVAPADNVEVPERIAALGARYLPVKLARTGLNPWADYQAYRHLRQLIEAERPALVLAYTIKAVTYGIPAAYAAGVPRLYALITGLGSAFHSRGWKGRLLSTVASLLYCRAFRHCARVMVQNQDIADMFARTQVVAADKLVVMPGSGVDLGHYRFVAFPNTFPRFLLVARLLRDKGIVEYVEAAKRVKQVVPDAEFWLVGDVDPNPAGIPLEEVQAWHAAGIIDYKGPQADVRPFFANCTTYVLPSYHEGMPRSVLEALATGRAVITTDTAGCRDTIKNHRRDETSASGVVLGDNGLLVPVKSGEALAEAMIRLARDPGLTQAMGLSGRAFAEDYFDVRKVNALMLETMGLGGISDRPIS